MLSWIKITECIVVMILELFTNYQIVIENNYVPEQMTLNTVHALGLR